jgi:hypothetical protein
MESTRSYPFSDLSPADVRRIVDTARSEQGEFVRQSLRSLFRRSAKRQPMPIECREPHPLLLVSNA